MNKLFPKIDNLEHFPLKVLMNIFARLDYMDLYNLAEESFRFKNIAKIVLNERYSHEYFIIDETKYEKETYVDFFERFGSEIKAIKVQNENMPIYDSDYDDDWITSLLGKTKNLEKLTLERLPYSYYTKVLQHVNDNITHLILRDLHDNFHPSRFRNLMKLEIKNTAAFEFDELEEIFHSNPALESLILGDEFTKMRESYLGWEYSFDELVKLIGTYLKQLKELEYTPIISSWFKKMLREDGIVDLSEVDIEKFVGSLKHLESLGLSSDIKYYTDFNELLRRLNSECKSIKHLKLYNIDGYDSELFEIIRSFENIESLALAFARFGDEIEFLVEDLRFLRNLDVTMHSKGIDWSFVLRLLRKCSTLEKLTVTGDPWVSKMGWFGTKDFYNQFIESMQNRNVQLEVKYEDHTIGFISKDGAIWRNKLIHWVGCDQNSSNIHLLDLAKKPSIVTSDANAEQPGPFDLILGYLDLNCLYSFSQTSKMCSQLVKNHVIQHSQKQETLTITNEFCRNPYGLGGRYGGLEVFADYVTDLKVDIVHENIADLKDLLKSFHNLKKLHIYAEVNIRPLDLIVPQVQHLIYDGVRFMELSDLNELSYRCPDLETFELKGPMYIGFGNKGERLNFRNLKSFTLKYHEALQSHVKDLKKHFKGTNTKLFFRI